MNCPCKDCLVFAICKRRLADRYGSQVVQLSTNCPLLSKYIKQTSENTETTRSVFGLFSWQAKLRS